MTRPAALGEFFCLQGNFSSLTTTAIFLPFLPFLPFLMPRYSLTLARYLEAQASEYASLLDEGNKAKFIQDVVLHLSTDEKLAGLLPGGWPQWNPKGRFDVSAAIDWCGPHVHP